MLVAGDQSFSKSSRAWAPGAPRAWKALRRRLAPENLLIRRLERRALENQRVCIAVSHRVRDWLLEAHPFLAGRDVRVIYNRPDLDRFSPGDAADRAAARKALGIDGDRPFIATAGTNFALKGLEPLIRALALLPGEPVLHVAGGRNPGRFKALAHSLGLGERIVFAGRVKDMARLYRACDLFCLPSFYDTCSNAVVEALACGTRVVSSIDNGSSHFLPPEHIVADPGDHATLAQTIERTLATPRPGPFSWPQDVPCGLTPYLTLFDDLLATS